jgi:hypothetical protein
MNSLSIFFQEIIILSLEMTMNIPENAMDLDLRKIGAAFLAIRCYTPPTNHQPPKGLNPREPGRRIQHL